METFSALLAICEGNSPVPEISPHKGQWRGALMFSLIWAWINGWVNNREACDLRRNRAHYDVVVMVTHKGCGGIACYSHDKTALAISRPDEIRPGTKSSGWFTQISSCHADDTAMIIQVTYGACSMSSPWHTLSHPDDMTPFEQVIRTT